MEYVYFLWLLLLNKPPESWITTKLMPQNCCLRIPFHSHLSSLCRDLHPHFSLHNTKTVYIIPPYSNYTLSTPWSTYRPIFYPYWCFSPNYYTPHSCSARSIISPNVHSYLLPSSTVPTPSLILTVALQLLVSSPLLYKITLYNFWSFINTLAPQSILPFTDSAKENNVRSTVHILYRHSNLLFNLPSQSTVFFAEIFALLQYFHHLLSQQILPGIAVVIFIESRRFCAPF